MNPKPSPPPARSKSHPRRNKKDHAKTLSASELRYRRLFETAQDGILILDARTGLVMEVNPFLVKLLGFSHEDFLGKKAWELGFFKSIAANQTRFKKLRQKGCVRHENMTLETRDGQRLDVEFVSNVYLENHRKVIQCNIRDNTARKRVEESHAWLAAAVEQAEETIMITDASGTILYVNPSFEKITGYTRAEAIGQNPRMLKSGKQDAAFYQRMWAVLGQGEVWRGRFINGKKDGTLYEENATISPVRDAAGRIVNYVAVKHDVTHEAHLEAQLRQAQKMESIGRLAGGIAHDFNNLLTAIMGYNDMTLKALCDKDPLREHVEEVRAASVRAVMLTQQLLAFSRKQVLLPRMLDLNHLTGNLGKMLHRLIGENIRLTTTFDPDLDCVTADPGQIEQVITNLAVNARDAMPEGGTLVLQTANVELDAAHDASEYEEVPPGRYVLLSITDTGTGMTDEVKAHLFEPFFTTKEQGTGLGLPTVYGIVKQSGGHITVSSEAGRGTAFKIYLPRVKEASRAARPARASGKFPSGTETILLVENEEQVRNLARMLLTECGYTVLVAGSGPDAIHLAKQHEGKIQMLLTDVIMPEMNGRVLASLLATLNPGIKVLYMSGHTDTTLLQQDVLGAGSIFLRKPFSLETLARKVREALDAQPTQKQQARPVQSKKNPP